MNTIGLRSHHTWLEGKCIVTLRLHLWIWMFNILQRGGVMVWVWDWLVYWSRCWTHNGLRRHFLHLLLVSWWNSTKKTRWAFSIQIVAFLIAVWIEDIQILIMLIIYINSTIDDAFWRRWLIRVCHVRMKLLGRWRIVYSLVLWQVPFFRAIVCSHLVVQVSIQIVKTDRVYWLNILGCWSHVVFLHMNDFRTSVTIVWVLTVFWIALVAHRSLW